MVEEIIKKKEDVEVEELLEERDKSALIFIKLIENNQKHNKILNKTYDKCGSTNQRHLR